MDWRNHGKRKLKYITKISDLQQQLEAITKDKWIEKNHNLHLQHETRELKAGRRARSNSRIAN